MFVVVPSLGRSMGGHVGKYEEIKLRMVLGGSCVHNNSCGVGCITFRPFYAISHSMIGRRKETLPMGF